MTKPKIKNPSKYAQGLIDKGWAIKRAIDRGDRDAVDILVDIKAGYVDEEYERGLKGLHKDRLYPKNKHPEDLLDKIKERAMNGCTGDVVEAAKCLCRKLEDLLEDENPFDSHRVKSQNCEWEGAKIYFEEIKNLRSKIDEKVKKQLKKK